MIDVMEHRLLTSIIISAHLYFIIAVDEKSKRFVL